MRLPPAIEEIDLNEGNNRSAKLADEKEARIVLSSEPRSRPALRGRDAPLCSLLRAAAGKDRCLVGATTVEWNPFSNGGNALILSLGSPVPFLSRFLWDA